MKIVEEDTILFQKNDKIESLFFILEGKVEYLDDCNHTYLTVGPHKVFGFEDFIFRMDKKERA